FENIADPANCMDKLLLERVVHLCAQSSHDDVNDVCVGLEIYVPDVLGDLGARDDLTSRTDEVSEQTKFFRREIQWHASTDVAVVARIDVHVLDAEGFVALCWDEVAQRPEACEQ